MIVRGTLIDRSLGLGVPLLGSLACAAVLGAVVARTDPSSDPRLAAEVILGLLTLACAWRWRFGVYAVLVYLTLEGFVTNALYPLTLAVLFKDVLLVATYSGFLLAARRHDLLSLRPSVVWPLGALAGLCLAESLNPFGVEPQVALVGMRVLLLYTPLYFVGLALARDASTLRRLTRLILFTSLPITLFGILQWALGPQATAALGPGFARSIWIIGPEASSQLIYRPTSTFSFVGHFGDYLFFIVVVAFAALHERMGWMERSLVAAVFLSAAVATVVEAQRTTWVLLPLAIVGTTLIARNGKGMLRAAPVIVGGTILAGVVGSSVLSNRLPLLANLGLYTDRFNASSANAFRNANLLSLEGLIGHGTGTALGAIRYVTGGVVPAAFESGWFIPFYMFGVLGLLVFAWLYAAVLVEAWRGVHAVPRSERSVPAALFCFLALTAAISGPITMPPSNVYFWLFAGLLAGQYGRRAP